MTAVVAQPSEPRYNGFTCPNCGSHMFSTTLGWRREHGDRWPLGSNIGHCYEHVYRNTSCRYEWNRADKQKEELAIYEMTPQEWLTTLEDLRVRAKEIAVYEPGTDESVWWGKAACAMRVSNLRDARNRSFWRVYPETGRPYYAIIDDFGSLVKVA